MSNNIESYSMHDILRTAGNGNIVAGGIELYSRYEAKYKKQNENEVTPGMAIIILLFLVIFLVARADNWERIEAKEKARQEKKEAKAKTRQERKTAKAKKEAAAYTWWIKPDEEETATITAAPISTAPTTETPVVSVTTAKSEPPQEIRSEPYASNEDIALFTEGYKIESLDSTTYYLTKTGGTLEFDRASVICHISFCEPMHNCEYRVHSKQFKDLSFVKGEKVKDLSDGISIRKYEDGTRYLYFHEEIPTFDSGDRDWDSDRVVVMYVDEDGVTLIHCRFGYGIPRIEVYCRLKKSTEKVNELLRELGCDIVEEP